MPLVTSKEILLDAKKNNYAVGAFNANNMAVSYTHLDVYKRQTFIIIVFKEYSFNI